MTSHMMKSAYGGAIQKEMNEGFLSCLVAGRWCCGSMRGAMIELSYAWGGSPNHDGFGNVG